MNETRNPPNAALLLHIAALEAEVAQLRTEVSKLRTELDYRAGEAAALRFMLVHLPVIAPDEPLPQFH